MRYVKRISQVCRFASAMQSACHSVSGADWFPAVPGVARPRPLTNALMLVVMCGAVGPLGAGHRCEVCGKLLSTRLTLKRHTEQQHLQPLHSARCTLCHKVFRTLNSLNNHKSIYHRRQRNPPPLSQPHSLAQSLAQPQNLSAGVEPKLNPPHHNIDFYKFKDQFNV